MEPAQLSTKSQNRKCLTKSLYIAEILQCFLCDNKTFEQDRNAKKRYYDENGILLMKLAFFETFYT